MGIFSWLRSRQMRDLAGSSSNLVRYRYVDPELQGVEEAAAADLAVLEGKAKGVPDPSRSLLRSRYQDPELEDVEEAAATDLAAMKEENDTSFGPNSPANRDAGF
jgi:hypothetical protein